MNQIAGIFCSHQRSAVNYDTAGGIKILIRVRNAYVIFQMDKEQLQKPDPMCLCSIGVENRLNYNKLFLT